MPDDAFDLRPFIRDVPDFPKEGILFRDVTPLLADAHAFRVAIDRMAEPFVGQRIDRVIGIESRGFFLGGPVALELAAGLVIVRKQGRLPWRTRAVTYDLEYGTDTVEMHEDAVAPGERVLVVDDLVATGGTAAATVTLAREAGADVVGCSFLVELAELGGRAKLGVDRINALIRY